MAIVKVQPTRLLLKMRHQQTRASVQRQVARANTHARLLIPFATHSHAAIKTLLAERAVAIVHQQQTRRGVAGEEEVRPSIVVEVCCHDRHPVRPTVLSDSGGLAYVGEGAVPIVAVQGVAAWRKSTRSAVDQQSFIGTCGILHCRLWRVIEVELNVVRDEEIKMPVAVVIKEAASRGEAPRCVQ